MIFRLTATTMNSPEIGAYIAYGIVSEGEEPVNIEDISSNRQAVCELIDKLNTNHVSPLHVKDVITDWLNQ